MMQRREEQQQQAQWQEQQRLLQQQQHLQSCVNVWRCARVRVAVCVRECVFAGKRRRLWSCRVW
jgi:hypothetical protein